MSSLSQKLAELSRIQNAPVKQRKIRCGSHDSFGTEATPIAAFIIGDLGGLMSRSTAKQQGRYVNRQELWEDAPRLRHPTHNKVYQPNGQAPDTAATALFDAGLLREGSVTEMWRALACESQTARAILIQCAYIAPQHGGRRKGAGRKSEGKARCNVTLNADNVKRAQAHTDNLSGLLDRLLAEHLAAHPF